MNRRENVFEIYINLLTVTLLHFTVKIKNHTFNMASGRRLRKKIIEIGPCDISYVFRLYLYPMTFLFPKSCQRLLRNNKSKKTFFINNSNKVMQWWHYDLSNVMNFETIFNAVSFFEICSVVAEIKKLFIFLFKNKTFSPTTKPIKKIKRHCIVIQSTIHMQCRKIPIHLDDAQNLSFSF